jgi:hypothetical protein
VGERKVLTLLKLERGRKRARAKVRRYEGSESEAIVDLGCSVGRKRRNERNRERAPTPIDNTAMRGSELIGPIDDTGMRDD